MYLSDLKDEKAIDALADILEPIAKILADQEIKDIYYSKPKILLVQYVLKHYRNEVVDVLAALHSKTRETYHFTIISLTKDLLEILNDPEINAVFTSQSQNNGEIASGSAMENTEESEA